MHGSSKNIRLFDQIVNLVMHIAQLKVLIFQLFNVSLCFIILCSHVGSFVDFLNDCLSFLILYFCRWTFNLSASKQVAAGIPR